MLYFLDQRFLRLRRPVSVRAVKQKLDRPWPFGTKQGFFVGDFLHKVCERRISRFIKSRDFS